MSKELLDLRKIHPTTFYIIDSHWDILTEIEKTRGLHYKLRYIHIQNKKDREKRIHSPDLYLIWNMKSFIANKICKENPYNSTNFIYTDSGAWRQNPIPNWPDVSFVNRIVKLLNNKILFGQISDEKPFNFQLDFIEATFFAGSRIAIDNFYNDFWKLHDEKFIKWIHLINFSS